MHQSGDWLPFNGMGFQLTVRKSSAWKITVYLILGYLNQAIADDNTVIDVHTSYL
jgi:hypothetical protein